MIKDYNPTGVKETDLVDPHGNKGYNVFFEGEDKPVFMMAKRAPEVGTPEYGEIVDTPKKSGDGTYRKFVRKQREEDAVAAAEEAEEKQFQEQVEVEKKTYEENRAKEAKDKEESIFRCNALNNATAAFVAGKIDDPMEMADHFLNWLRNDDAKVEEDVPLPEPQGEVTIIDDGDINLDDIPF